MKIVLTGGGTAGHVMPNLALIPYFRTNKWDYYYIGGKGIERDLCLDQQILFKEIATGKLRRYFSLKNLTDVFKVIVGIFQSLYYLLKDRPNIVFSKGGFVSVPVAIAAWILRIPFLTHESDITPGLANKILAPFSKKVLYAFPQTKDFLNQQKSLYVGQPVREGLLEGQKNKGFEYCGFDKEQGNPILLVMGGSQGAEKINSLIYEYIDEFLENFRIIHLTGKGKKKDLSRVGYVSFEFLGAELADIFSITDFAVSRAGANSIFELLRLNIPMLLIPLLQGSRGDQIKNAKAFNENGWALIQEEQSINKSSFFESLASLKKKKDQIKSKQNEANLANSISRIVEIIDNKTQ